MSEEQAPDHPVERPEVVRHRLETVEGRARRAPAFYTLLGLILAAAAALASFYLDGTLQPAQTPALATAEVGLTSAVLGLCGLAAGLAVGYGRSESLAEHAEALRDVLAVAERVHRQRAPETVPAAGEPEPEPDQPEHTGLTF